MKDSFKDMDIFVGLDVHLKSWDIRVMTAHTFQKQIHVANPTPEFVVDFLTSHYPGVTYHCVYEAGFSGYWIQEQLSQNGVETIIVHPADVPVTDKEKRFKNDRIDSTKLANTLRSGQLKGIYIPSKEDQINRSLVRLRYQYARDEKKMKNRIKSHLYFYGITTEEIEASTHWSNRYLQALKSYAQQHDDVVLLNHLDKLAHEREHVLQATRQLRQLAKSDRYKESFDLLISIPGVGFLTAIVFLTEVMDINRFKGDDQLVAYVGFTPGSQASGEKDPTQSISKRGNRILRTAVIQAAWMAVRSNPKMAYSYEQYKSRGMTSNKAIIKIARKLVLCMRSVLVNCKKYRLCNK